MTATAGFKQREEKVDTVPSDAIDREDLLRYAGQQQVQRRNCSLQTLEKINSREKEVLVPRKLNMELKPQSCKTEDTLYITSRSTKGTDFPEIAVAVQMNKGIERITKTALSAIESDAAT